MREDDALELLAMPEPEESLDFSVNEFCSLLDLEKYRKQLESSLVDKPSVLVVMQILGTLASKGLTDLEELEKKGPIKALKRLLWAEDAELSIQAFITLVNINLQLDDFEKRLKLPTSENQQYIGHCVLILLKIIVPKFGKEFRDRGEKCKYAWSLLREISGKTLVNEALFWQLEKCIELSRRKRKANHSIAHTQEDTSLSM